MRKVFLGLMILALISVSCKDETKEKIEEANEAVGAEIEEKMDTASVKIDKAIDKPKEVIEKKENTPVNKDKPKTEKESFLLFD